MRCAAKRPRADAFSHDDDNAGSSAAVPAPWTSLLTTLGRAEHAHAAHDAAEGLRESLVAATMPVAVGTDTSSEDGRAISVPVPASAAAAGREFPLLLPPPAKRRRLLRAEHGRPSRGVVGCGRDVAGCLLHVAATGACPGAAAALRLLAALAAPADGVPAVQMTDAHTTGVERVLARVRWGEGPTGGPPTVAGARDPLSLEPYVRSDSDGNSTARRSGCPARWEARWTGKRGRAWRWKGFGRSRSTTATAATPPWRYLRGNPLSSVPVHPHDEGACGNALLYELLSLVPALPSAAQAAALAAVDVFGVHATGVGGRAVRGRTSQTHNRPPRLWSRRWRRRSIFAAARPQPPWCRRLSHRPVRPAGAHPRSGPRPTAPHALRRKWLGCVLRVMLERGDGDGERSHAACDGVAYAAGHVARTVLCSVAARPVDEGGSAPPALGALIMAWTAPPGARCLLGFREERAYLGALFAGVLAGSVAMVTRHAVEATPADEVRKGRGDGYDYGHGHGRIREGSKEEDASDETASSDVKPAGTIRDETPGTSSGLSSDDGDGENSSSDGVRDVGIGEEEEEVMEEAGVDSVDDAVAYANACSGHNPLGLPGSSDDDGEEAIIPSPRQDHADGGASDGGQNDSETANARVGSSIFDVQWPLPRASSVDSSDLRPPSAAAPRVLNAAPTTPQSERGGGADDDEHDDIEDIDSDTDTTNDVPLLAPDGPPSRVLRDTCPLGPDGSYAGAIRRRRVHRDRAWFVAAVTANDDALVYLLTVSVAVDRDWRAGGAGHPDGTTDAPLPRLLREYAYATFAPIAILGAWILRVGSGDAASELFWDILSSSSQGAALAVLRFLLHVAKTTTRSGMRGGGRPAGATHAELDAITPFFHTFATTGRRVAACVPFNPAPLLARVGRWLAA